MTYLHKQSLRIIGLLLAGCLLLSAVGPLSAHAQSDSATLETATSSEATDITPQFLFIPKLSVATVVESVGVNNEGRMAVPDNWRNASWFQPGFEPGGAGHAVFAAHRDWESEPGPFFRLQDLASGDSIYVVGSGNIQIYTVTDSVSYDRSDNPTRDVFGAADKPSLSLITCEGRFVESADTYADRRVISAELSHVWK